MRHTQEQESIIRRVEIDAVDGQVHVCIFGPEQRIITLKLDATDAEKIRAGLDVVIETIKSEAKLRVRKYSNDTGEERPKWKRICAELREADHAYGAEEIERLQAENERLTRAEAGSALKDKPVARLELGRLMAIVLQDEADVSQDDLEFVRTFALVWDNYLKEWVYSPSVLLSAGL